MRSRLLLIVPPVCLCVLLLAGDATHGQAPPLRETFRRVQRSVVVVRTVKETAALLPQQGIGSVAGVASGVLISQDGKVLTAAHIVQAVDQVAVELADGQRVPARVLASVTSADVALLQLAVVPPGLAPAHLGDSDTVEVGDDVFVVGAPYGLSRTLTVGHVSGRQVAPSSLAPMAAREFFLTDAAVNPGNSGSPLFNRQGDVIGIVSSILSRSGGFEGLGVAATATMARRLLLERKPFWSGMEGILIQGDLAGVLNLPQPAGFVVQRVAAGSLGGRLVIRKKTFRISVEGSDLLLGGDIILAVSCAPRRLQGFVPDRTLADVCCTHGHCHEEENVWQVCLPTEAHGPLEPSTPRLSCPLTSLMRPRCPWKRGGCARSHARRTRPGASGEAAHDTAGTPPSYSARTPRTDGSAVTFGSRGHRICRRPARRARTGL